MSYVIKFGALYLGNDGDLVTSQRDAKRFPVAEISTAKDFGGIRPVRLTRANAGAVVDVPTTDDAIDPVVVDLSSTVTVNS